MVESLSTFAKRNIRTICRKRYSKLRHRMQRNVLKQNSEFQWIEHEWGIFNDFLRTGLRNLWVLKRKCWNYARLLNDDRISEDSWNFRASSQQHSHSLESLYNSGKSLALVWNCANCTRFLKSWSRVSRAFHDSSNWTCDKNYARSCRRLWYCVKSRRVTKKIPKDCKEKFPPLKPWK